MNYKDFWRRAGAVLALAAALTEGSWASWDGEPSLQAIDLNLESFIDINSYQFRRSEEIKWYDVENGLRIAAGSLETNLLYLSTDLRLKQEITPNVNVRLNLADEEFYESRDFPRPLLELEVTPTPLPLSLSLIGTPAYAKREADLGVAASIGQRPWNFFRVAWLSSDHYFNEKNELDESYYQREPSQLTLEAAFKWADRFKLRLLWQDNNPLEFVLDDQTAIFAYENRNYQMTFDYHADSDQHFGIALRGFETTQSLDDGASPRSQNIRYFSIDSYWFKQLEQKDEWTVGLKYDSFLNQERTPSESTTSFDYSHFTTQLYSSYYHPYSANQAWELGLFIGQASQEYDYLDGSLADSNDDRIEAKLRAAWELFSTDQSSALTFALSLNLDEIQSDPFDGGAVQFRTQF